MTLQKLRDKVVRPQDLCFTQESICVTFQRPRNQERIDDAVDLILQRKLSPKAFPKMNVVQFQDRLWSLDNRRLWVFKKAEVDFITVTLVAVDFQDRFSTLPSTSPYLYASLSNPDFFPRIRGHCKEIFTDDDPDRRPSPSPPSTPHVRFRSGEIPTKIYKQTTHLSAPRSIPRPKLSSKHLNFPPPSKVAPQSKDFNYYAHHHEPVEYANHRHEPFDYDKRHREALDYDHHYTGLGHLRKEHSNYPHFSRRRNTETPPIPRKHGNDGLSHPKSSKRYYEDACHFSRIPHEDFCHHSRRSDEAMRHPSRPIHPAAGHTSKTREFARRTPNEAGSLTSKRPRASSQAREFEASSPAPKPRVPVPPEDRRARSRSPRPAREVRASSPTRTTNLPTHPVRDPEKRIRSSERNSSSPGSLPPYRSTEPKVPGNHRHERLPPVPLEGFASRGEDVKSSKSRAAALPLPALKRSKTSKPSSNPRPFSYGFHSHPKRSKASKSSKKTVSSPRSHPPSIQLNDGPGHTSMPSSTSTEDRIPPPQRLGAPLPSPSTTAPLLTTKTREKDDCSNSDLPIPAVPASRSPSRTRCPIEKHCHRSGDEFHSSIIGTILGTDPPENHHHHWKCGISRTTKTRQEAPGLANCTPEIHLILSETEENLFKLDKQPTVDPKLHLPPTPTKELITKADLADVLNCVEEINRSLHPPIVENPSKKQRKVESADNLPTRTPIEVSQVTQQPDNGPDELKNLSGQEGFQESKVGVHSIVECPVEYDTLIESTLKDIWSLKAPSTAYYGDSDVRRAASNVDITVTASLEPPQPQLSTPSRTKEVQEAQFTAKAVNATDHLHVPNQVWKYWRKGYQEMARTAVNDLCSNLDITTQACQTTGDEIPDASQRITRGQVRERERRERRDKRKKREAEEEREPEKKEEREVEKKKEREAEKEKETQPEKKMETRPEKKKETQAEKKKETQPEKKKETEAEQKNETEAEKKKQREAEKKKQREAEKKKEREAEKKKEREADKRKEREAAKAREAEKKEREADKRKAREAEKRKAREAEKKREANKKKEKETALLEMKSRSASTYIGKEIVPYDAARSRKASSSDKVLSGDMVYVKVIGQITESGTEEQKSTCSSGRVHPYLRVIGPFRVHRMCNKFSAMLELPDDCDLKPIFNLTVLKKSKCTEDNDLPNKRLIIELKPEAILNARVARRLRKRKVLHYLVKWKSLPATEATWEPASIFDEHPSLLDQIDSPLLANPYMLRNWRA